MGIKITTVLPLLIVGINPYKPCWSPYMWTGMFFTAGTWWRNHSRKKRELTSLWCNTGHMSWAALHLSLAPTNRWMSLSQEIDTWLELVCLEDGGLQAQSLKRKRKWHWIVSESEIEDKTWLSLHSRTQTTVPNNNTVQAQYNDHTKTNKQKKNYIQYIKNMQR